MDINKLCLTEKQPQEYTDAQIESAVIVVATIFSRLKKEAIRRGIWNKLRGKHIEPAQ